MPDRRLTKIFFTVILVLIVLESIGQKTSSLKNNLEGNLQINYNLGFTQFYGDASSNGYFKKISGEISFATGATVRKYINPIFGLGINFLYSGLKSNKVVRATGDSANFILTGKYFDGNVNLLVDFNSLLWGPSSRKLSVYGIVGLGYAAWNSKLVDSLTNKVRNSGDTIGNNTYKKGGFVVPVGIGVNYMLSNNWALNIEMNLRNILNDDVDVWRDGFKYDQVLYTSIGISYFINRKSGSNKKRKEKRTENLEHLKAIPFVDYKIQEGSKNKTGDIEQRFVTLDIPVEIIKDKPTGVIYRVQILAKRNKQNSVNYLRERFNIEGDIYESYQDGMYRYSTGSFSSYKEALQYSYIVKEKGITEAFVVAYENDKRITISNAMKR